MWQSVPSAHIGPLSLAVPGWAMQCNGSTVAAAVAVTCPHLPCSVPRLGWLYELPVPYKLHAMTGRDCWIDEAANGICALCQQRKGSAKGQRRAPDLYKVSLSAFSVSVPFRHWHRLCRLLRRRSNLTLAALYSIRRKQLLLSIVLYTLCRSRHLGASLAFSALNPAKPIQLLLS